MRGERAESMGRLPELEEYRLEIDGKHRRLQTSGGDSAGDRQVKMDRGKEHIFTVIGRAKHDARLVLYLMAGTRPPAHYDGSWRMELSRADPNRDGP